MMLKCSKCGFTDGPKAAQHHCCDSSSKKFNLDNFINVYMEMTEEEIEQHKLAEKRNTVKEDKKHPSVKEKGGGIGSRKKLDPEVRAMFDENWSCLKCGKKQKDLPSAKRHYLVHVPSRPFVCDICGEGFKAKSHLKTHTEYKHSTSKFECTLCSKVFAIKGELNRHIKKTHGDNTYLCV